jgi:thiamine biosynthesis lipoprotein
VLSSWREDSEIGRLNASQAGSRLSLSPELFALLAESGRWVEATGGAFDPAIGALIDAWDLRGEGRIPSAAQLAAARAASGWALLELTDRAREATRRHARWWLDTGAFGKGAALRAASALLRARTQAPALLDFGGQILALGKPAAGAWEIAVAHPARRHEPAALLRLTDASASTTSSSERFVTVKGERLGHVLDPRTGSPVPAWGSVTVVHTDAFVADVLSTALYVMGPEAGLRWAEERGDVAALFLIDAAGGLQAKWSAPMARWLMGTPAGGSAAERARVESDPR